MIKDILDTLIQDSLSMRISNRASREYSGSGIEYAIQFKTIGLRTPRRYGKSSYIKEFASSTVDRVAIVVPNRLNDRIYDTNNPGVRIYSVQELKNKMNMHDICRIDYNWVFFDDVDVCSNLKHQFTDYFNNHCNTLQTFVWLNT